MDINLIHLQDAHTTQFTANGEKGPWLVRKNITSEDLAELPKDLTEGEVFSVLDFAKKFELIALNVGIKYGQMMFKSKFDLIVTDYNNQLQLLRDENERLATALLKQISKEQ